MTATKTPAETLAEATESEIIAAARQAVKNPWNGHVPAEFYRDDETGEYEKEYDFDEELDEDGENEEEAPLSLADFIDRYRDAIADTVTKTYQPLYRPGDPRDREPLPPLLRPPMGAQEHAVRGVALSLRANPGTMVVGEMGTGKTYIAAVAPKMAGFKNVLVICPPHMTRKWKREVEITLPDAHAAIVRTVSDLRKLGPAPRDGIRFTIMSRESAKLTYRWEPAFVTKNGMIVCPDCFERPLDGKGIPLDQGDLARRKSRCNHCGAALWGPNKEARHLAKCKCRDCGDGSGPPQPLYRKYALGDYIKKKMHRQFDLLIADEVHEYKSRDSAQGVIAGNLAQDCGKALTLTGTLMGGYSSTLFHLLYRFSPSLRQDFEHGQVSRWIDRYGFRQRRFRYDKDDGWTDGRSSRRRTNRPTDRENPGLAPAALFHIIGNSVFLRLNDITQALPPYDEIISVHPMDQEKDEAAGFSQQSGYDLLLRRVGGAMRAALARGSNRLMSVYLQSLLAYPDACANGETVIDPDVHIPEDTVIHPEHEAVIAHVPPLDAEKEYPKEKALLELAREEKAQGRKTLVYVTHSDRRDLIPRVEQFLERNGIRTAVMRSSQPGKRDGEADPVQPSPRRAYTATPKPENREAWVAERVKEGIDVLICNPRLVQTGLDLVDFPTICWYETDYSVYTMRQASRRSWRIGQDRPVRVVYMVYDGTLQADALKLVARKMQSSLAVEGELPEEGLTAFGDDSQDLVLTLAKRIVNDEDFPIRDSLERIFARTRAQERDDERYLVDDGWEFDIETGSDPAPAEGEEPHEPVETGPAETEPELVEPDTKLDPEPVEPEPVPGAVIFSWAEFMAEPLSTPGRGRGRKAPDQAASLFAWAAEQEEKAGAP